MQFGKRLALASAIAVLGGAGTAYAAPVPPKTATALARRQRRAGAGAGGPDVRQRHGAERLLDDRRDHRRGLGRVGLRHRRGRQEGPHARGLHAAAGDADRRAEGPGRLRGQPVLRGHRRGAQLARRPRARRHQHPPPAGVLQRDEHEPEHLQRARGHLAAARLRRRALRVARLGLLRRLPDLRRASTRRSARRRSSTGSTAAARATRPAPATSRRRP